MPLLSDKWGAQTLYAACSGPSISDVSSSSFSHAYPKGSREPGDIRGLVDMENRVREWRRLIRTELRSKRTALPSHEKESVRKRVCDLILKTFPELRDACMGFYWPFQGEIDLRSLVRNFIALGAEAALPVVVKKQQPMEFWSWQPQMKLVRGIWNIPIPSERNPVRPRVLLVPLLGFDLAGYRLGYGGGYYDRTLATFAQKPLTIGIGYELSRLGTIYPQPHDISMDAIVTESGVERSHPC